jgi:predicted protein tyrosine phosphatase
LSIIVCPLSRVPALIEQHAPGRLISLLDPETPFPGCDPLPAAAHLRLSLHDIIEAEQGLMAPSEAHIDDLLAFIEDWERDAPILIHCYAGISRSTATAFITACVHNPKTDEEEIAWALRRASPTATPNSRLVALADASLARGGRMSRAVAAIGRGGTWEEIGEAKPFEMASRFGV